MTWGGRTILIVASVLALSPVKSALARQQGSRTPQATRVDSRAVAQGFSVVLVLADLQASNVQDDVPPAARRALADMKDFLPYKSYKLLDAAWILGQGSSGTVTRLRGPDEHEYELRMQTSPARVGLAAQDAAASQRPNNSVHVRFTLSEQSQPKEIAQLETARRAEEAHRVTQRDQQEVLRLESELRAAQKQRDEARIRALHTELTAARSHTRNTQTAKPTTKRYSGPVMETSFTMEVGETVVVGTSRLKGNSRALIALLTAVPSKGYRPPTEAR